MSNESPLDSDLVQDSRLPTTFLPDGETEHTIWRSDKSGRRRGSLKNEIWRREPGKQIGSGSFGQVWLERSSTGRVRALKAIRKEPEFSAMAYARELEATAKFSHDRVRHALVSRHYGTPIDGLMADHDCPKYVDCFVKSYGWFEDEKKIYIAMEYLQYGDLGKHIDKEICESEAQDITSQLVQGLYHLHENKFVHRDLKPQNILVVQPGPNWWVKIADLGLSKRIRENVDAGSTAIGTERYCAPEVLRVTAESSPTDEPFEQSHKAARDLWALGEVLFRTLVKRPAFSTNYEVYRFAEGHETFERQLSAMSDRDLSVECVSFVEKLLIPDPKSRISAAAAILDPWLQSVDFSSPSTSRSSTPTTQKVAPARILPSYPIIDTERSDSGSTRKGSCQWSTGLLDEAEDNHEVHVDSMNRPRTPDQGSQGCDSHEHNSSRASGPSTLEVPVDKRNIQALTVGPLANFVERVEFDRLANLGGDRNDQYLREPTSEHHLGFAPATRDTSQGLELQRTAEIGGNPVKGRFEESGGHTQKIPRRFRSVSILRGDAEQQGNWSPPSRIGTRSTEAATVTSARPGPEGRGQAYYPANGSVQSPARPPRTRRAYIDKSHGSTPEATLKPFFCAHPWCTNSDLAALCLDPYAHAFGSLVGLLQHISEYHPDFSRGGPGEFLCACPHPGDQQVQPASFPSLRELLDHLTGFATHEQGEMKPLFSWGYIATRWSYPPLASYAGDYQIYIAAFPSMGHMVGVLANQYARMAYASTKYRVVDKKQRFLVHGSQFPPPSPPPPHDMPPSTMPSGAFTEEVYFGLPPSQPSLQRSSSARSLRSRALTIHQDLSRPHMNAPPGAQTPPPYGYPPSGGVSMLVNPDRNQGMLANALTRSHGFHHPTMFSTSSEASRAQPYRPQVLQQAGARPSSYAGPIGPGQNRGSRSNSRSEVKPKVHHHSNAPSRLQQHGPQREGWAPQERMQDHALKDESALRARVSALQLEYEERQRQEILEHEKRQRQEISQMGREAKILTKARKKTRNTKIERRSRDPPLVLRGDNFSIHLDPPEDGSNVVVTLDSGKSSN